MNARKLILYFYGIEVVIESDSDDLLKRLALDFSYFTIKAEVTHSVFVKALQRPPVHMSDKVEQIFKSSKVEVFEEYPIRYSLYGSDGMSVWDQNKEQVTLFSVEINLLHEITYLFILSRVGKCLDLEGLHRLHASCVIINDTLVLGMMSSGVGKSTLAAFLLEYPEVSFYSDDSPLINSEGEVLPFPIRFGFQEHGLVPDS